ncbi:MAG TPA: hypothetical protein VGQ57_04855, partial [Polyangiaceae bacterium]|nr:hypothetical protein [Polyangiaceae bacterium]
MIGISAIPLSKRGSFGVRRADPGQGSERAATNVFDVVVNEEKQKLLIECTLLTDTSELRRQLPPGVGLPGVESDARERREQGAVLIGDPSGEVLNLVVSGNGVEHRLNFFIRPRVERSSGEKLQHGGVIVTKVRVVAFPFSMTRPWSERARPRLKPACLAQQI